MKKYFCLLVITILTIVEVTAQNPSVVPDNIPDAYINYIYNESEIISAKNITYETVPKFNIPESTSNTQESVQLDVYYTSANSNNICMPLKPLIVFCHGNNEDKGDYTRICTDLARRGYVVASINFRGNTVNPLLTNINLPQNHPRATITGAMEFHNAIKFLTNSSNSVTYGLNPNFVIIGGFSIGAFSALAAAYWDKTEITTYCQSKGIGTWINDPYYNDFDASLQSTKIKGVFSWSGAVYTDYFNTPATTTPLYMYHGNRDRNVPYKEGNFMWDIFKQTVYVYGSRVMSEYLNTKNISMFLSTAKDVGHTLQGNCQDDKNANFPSGYFNNWYNDMLIFLKNTILCGNFNRNQNIINCNSSSNCDNQIAACRDIDDAPGLLYNQSQNTTTPTINAIPLNSCMLSTTNEHCHAFSFDGGDYIKINSSSSLNSTESNDIDFWYKKSGTVPSNKINILYSSGIDNNINNSRLTIGLIGETQLWIYAKNSLSTNNTTQIINIPTLDNNWHHFTIAFFNTTLIISIDTWANQFTISSPFIININNSTHYFGGANYTTGTTSLPYTNSIGQIDNIRFWTNVPDPWGVGTMNIVNSGTYNICPSVGYLMGYWKLNADGQIIKDETNYHNDGTKGATSSIETSDPTYITNCNTSARTTNQPNNSLPVNEEIKNIDIDKKEILTVFPNPSSSKPSIIFLSPEQGTADIQLIDSKGVEIINLRNFNLNKNLNFISESIPNLSNGIYFIKITTNQKSHEEKFIITK